MHRFALALVLLATSATARPALTVGVLEVLAEKEGMARSGVGTALYRRHVRVLFRSEGVKWVAYPHRFSTPQDLQWSFEASPSPIQWNACHQGRRVGGFSSKHPPAIRAPALVGSQNIPDGTRLPVPGKATTEFAGYRGEPVPRPLILTTGQRCQDPDLWRRDDSATVDTKPLKALLRAEIAKPEWAKRAENEFEPPRYEFKDKDASVWRVYEAKRTGRKLVVLRVVDTLLAEHREMFYLPVDGTATRYVGGALNFLGAIDLDSRGTSYVILKMEAHNRDGYVLLEPGMERASEFVWSYR